MLQPSELDSRRFRLSVVRGNVADCDARTLAGAVMASRADVAIVRTPAGVPGPVQRLARWCLPVLHADTLVYYRCDLERHVPAPLRNPDLAFSRAGRADLAEVRALIAGTFSGYASHYHANPLFDRQDILDGYREWAEGHVDDSAATLWLARRAGAVIAFAACRDHPDGTAEGVLYGVSPQAAGGGVYGDLIRHTQAVARARGARAMKVSTQVHNHAVQKVWSREGFHMDASMDTWHVNALLSAGETLVDSELCFDAEAIARFAQASGDHNPLHVDPEAARAAGFPSTIAHGVMTLAELSRLLGTEAPGPGTVIARLDAAFLRPVVAGHAYRLQVRIPGGVRRDAWMQAVAQLMAPDGTHCVLARADVLLRG
jgi:acyl dehydratase